MSYCAAGGGSVSSLSSVSSNELDSVMGEPISEKNDDKKGGLHKDAFLACNEDKFPSDSEGSDLVDLNGADKNCAGGRRRKTASGGNANSKGAGAGATSGLKRGGTPPAVVTLQPPALPRFSRSTQMLQGGSDYDASMNPPAPCPLRGFKSGTVTRFQPMLALDAMLSGDSVQKKRRPRLEYSLRVCRDLVTDVLSKKHKDWAWPLYKLDKGKECKFTQPVFLFDIRNNFANRVYHNVDQFSLDMRKLIDNFCTVYPPGHQYHISAKKLEELLDREIKKVKDSEGRPGRRGSAGAAVATFADHGTPSTPLNPVDLSKGLTFGGLPAAGIGFSEGLSVAPPWTGGAGRGESNRSLVQEQFNGKEVRNDGNLGNCGSLWNLNPGRNLYATFGDCNNLDKRGSGSTGTEPSFCERFSEPMWGDVKDSCRRVESRCNGSRANTPRAGKRAVGPDDHDEDDAEEEESRCGGGGDKRARVEEGSANVNLSIVKREIFEQDESHASSDVPDPDPEMARKKFVCKWIGEGIKGTFFPGHISQEIRGLLRVPDENLIIDSEFLETLSYPDLDRVGGCVLGMLVGRQEEHFRGTLTNEPFQTACKTATDVIATTTTEWMAMDEHVAYLRESTHGMLLRLNRMQERGFASIKHLHDCKKRLNECSRVD